MDQFDIVFSLTAKHGTLDHMCVQALCEKPRCEKSSGTKNTVGNFDLLCDIYRDFGLILNILLLL